MNTTNDARAQGDRALSEPETQSAVGSTRLLADKDRLDWLDNGGRIAKFSDGWNAWIQGQQGYIRPTVREAIDACMSANKRSNNEHTKRHRSTQDAN